MRDVKSLGSYEKALIIPASVFISLFHLYTGRWGVEVPFLQRGLHLAILLPLCFLLYPATKNSPRDKTTAIDKLLAVLALLPSIYVIFQRDHLEARLEFVTPVLPLELGLGALMIVLVIEAVRRSATPVMAGLVALSLLYLPLGPYMPGILRHKGFSLTDMIEAVYLLTGEGFYGSLMGISATYIVLFVIFGAFIMLAGVGEYFSVLARAIAGRVRGGPAQIAVLSSALFGTLSGSAVANVCATGSFTIPLMKSRGLRPRFAAAVEAVASTGGQLMPPVMGAAAFILAEYVGIPYIQLALRSALIAVLYFIALSMMIYFYCLREDIRGELRSELPRGKEVLRQIYFVVPVILMFSLMVAGFSPMYAAFNGVLASAVLIMGKRPRRWQHNIWALITALQKGAEGTVMMATILAGAQIIIVAITRTGLGLIFGSLVISLSGGIKILALTLIATTTLIMGMGVPTTPAYVIGAALSAQALKQLGLSSLAAHMFVFYFAVISNITPPVAVAAFAAASIADSRPMRTGVEAFCLAISTYLVPFILAYNPVLLLQGSVREIAWAGGTALCGVCFLGAGVQGWLFGRLSLTLRAVVVVGSLFLVNPGFATDLLGFVAIAVVVVSQKVRKRPAQVSVVTVSKQR